VTKPSAAVDEASVRSGIERAFAALREDYEDYGNWRYPGPMDADEEWGWIGPFAWSEADYAHRFAMLLEREFPRAVHLEMPINERMRSDLEPLPEGVRRRHAQSIDIVISDLGEIAALPQTALDAGRAFRARRHEAFIEVKWFPKAAARWNGIDRDRFLKSVPADLARLERHLVAGRCAVGAMLVVDDRGTFLPEVTSDGIPHGVLFLPLGPPNVS
jgi:hypothetical protein